ncbi:IQ domain-containing protein C isoform X1 [Echeneis naucrates]|uniref:IQ domain-containing protein C isoform X1 n=1 Tax=Echeneis naucrates TaxID=173247 RepID=UPI0011139507|nr:IQ domain-containing protein C isoform X1 [Echeneis naucrates]
MVMDRDKWERTLVRFQACARGHLVRSEVRRAREDFEDIVREIDGGLTHLQWRDTPIPLPCFTDTDDLLLRLSSAASKSPDPGLHVTASPQSPAAGSGEPPAQKTGADEGNQRDRDGGVMESTGDSTTIWSSLELDVSSPLGPRQYSLAQDVPHTPEALRLHRNTLTMELVWLQQAIDSRKKYLSLKDRLTIS